MQLISNNAYTKELVYLVHFSQFYVVFQLQQEFLHLLSIGLYKEENNIINIEEECKLVNGKKVVNTRDLSKAQFNEYSDKVIILQQ